jgi:hypothetical protein
LRGQAPVQSLISAMTRLAITQITMITCIQIQRRDIRL